jgi:hypothetical protein
MMYTIVNSTANYAVLCYIILHYTFQTFGSYSGDCLKYQAVHWLQNHVIQLLTDA